MCTGSHLRQRIRDCSKAIVATHVHPRFLQLLMHCCECCACSPTLPIADLGHVLIHCELLHVCVNWAVLVGPCMIRLVARNVCDPKAFTNMQKCIVGVSWGLCLMPSIVYMNGCLLYRNASYPCAALVSPCMTWSFERLSIPRPSRTCTSASSECPEVDP